MVSPITMDLMSNSDRMATTSARHWLSGPGSNRHQAAGAFLSQRISQSSDRRQDARVVLPRVPSLDGCIRAPPSQSRATRSRATRARGDG